MTTQIIALIDGSALTQSVCDYASWSAQRLSAPLVLLNVLTESRTPHSLDFSGNIGIDAQQNLMQELVQVEAQRAKLARQQGLLILDQAEHWVQQKHPALTLHKRQRHGDLVDTVLTFADETRMLVIGRQGQDGPGIGQHIGHHVERVIRGVQKPVWVVNNDFQPPQRVMVAFDGSPTACKVIDTLAASPLCQNIPMVVVMVGEATVAHRAQLEAAVNTLTSAGLQATAEIIQGDVATVLMSYADAHALDAIVMGAYGHSRIREFFVGSHTNTLLMKAKKPLLLLR